MSHPGSTWTLGVHGIFLGIHKQFRLVKNRISPAAQGVYHAPPPPQPNAMTFFKSTNISSIPYRVVTDKKLIPTSALGALTKSTFNSLVLTFRMPGKVHNL